MDIKRELGMKLKEWRKRSTREPLQDSINLRAKRKNRMTQEDLAALADLSVDAISMIERGINFPTPATVEKLSKALGIPKHEFYINSEDMQAKNTKQELINSITGMLYNADEKTLKIILKQIEALVG